jgi:transposase InsO family protein
MRIYTDAATRQEAVEHVLTLKERKINVCKNFNIDRTTLYRWIKRYDGTLGSLENKPLIHIHEHPNAQTKEEKQAMRDTYIKYPDYGYTELYGLLRREHNYKRHFLTMYKYMKTLAPVARTSPITPYIPKPYNTPTMLGTKMQLDVKYVPHECYIGTSKYQKLYQYTIIDETTRERFLRAYNANNGKNSADFIKRAIAHFNYTTNEIQTDNGAEFTAPRGNAKKVHLLDVACKKLGIKHSKIKPYTPRHNGKVERSHRTDQERFYKMMRYKTLADLNKQLVVWCDRYNNTPSRAIKDKYEKRRYLSPLDKRAELIATLKEENKLDTVRFVNLSKVNVCSLS